jgi:ABC-type methionine transport system permease subunit
MDISKNTPNKSKSGHRMDTSIRLMLRASFFIFIGVLIVYMYYLSTEDKLLNQLLKMSSMIVSTLKSVPLPILIIIGYTMVVFYVGYQVGKNKK